MTRTRNRIHAQHTRLRKRIFNEVLKLREDNKSTSIPMDVSVNTNTTTSSEPIHEDFFEIFFDY